MALSQRSNLEFAVLEEHWDLTLLLEYAERAGNYRLEQQPAVLRAKVSSKHLIVASPVFAAMLDGKFREGRELQMKGSTEISLPDDNPVAMVLLLNIVHGMPSKVPRELDLDELLAVAVLVDKYQLHESVRLFVETWLRTLGPRCGLKCYSDRVTYWICIAYVFQKPYLLKPMIATAKYLLKGPLNTLGLPIPKSIVDNIDDGRKSVMARMIGIGQRIIKQEARKTKGAGDAIEPKDIGLLTISLQKADLLFPSRRPWAGVSVREILETLSKAAERESWPDKSCDFIHKVLLPARKLKHERLDYG